ncbi:membrane protein insertase YidC [Chryseobacterium sp. Ch-15]|uniref:Membrane protein insertase YidC n=1 Tax=Chryseobacterium muglaense TaxID=2893752 RepID=A0A9Q3UU98_9FLAO|nr:membrane protein insertase YidC [Chryseobacterium muglaense]MBD3906830.1 membrane protein insertase YidC [Chryseobacterium muglaense]MCC9034482.1 membrane protein insertase YidC [Chryseobacterium muglaense]MCM2556583.1 membrane protein insertase YidC [Chryseobacterium muglaense]
MQENKGLDKSQIISFAVLCLVLFGFMFYFQNNQQEEEKLKAEQQKTEQAKNPVKPTPAADINPNVTPNAIQVSNLANNELKLEFSSLGGQVSKVELLKYKAYDHKTDKADLPLNLITKNNSSYGFQFKDKSGKTVNTKDLVFSPVVNGNAVTLTANYNGATIQFIYTINNNPKAELKDQYTLDFKVRTQGLSNVTSDNKADFIWDYQVRNLEKGRAQEQTHSEFVYAFNNYKDYDYDGRTDMTEEKETLNWIGVKQQFFSSVIESKTGFTNSKGNQEGIEEGEYLKKLNFEGFVAMNGGEFNQDFTWYFMPLDLKLLNSYEGKNFDEILPLGWSFIGGMNRYFFMWLYSVIAGWGISAGWVIFLMTIIVKLILSPIMYKQHKLSAMMKVIRPEIDEANAKFKDADPMKKQQATMEIYRKAGVNQMAGCLPALVQIPIFYALFRFFPNFIDLRGQGFWFAKDLTAYDDLIKLPFNIPFLGDHLSVFAIACTIVILIYTVMTSGNMQQPQQEGMPNMKVIMYIFPITFLFFLNTSASGLSWYYFVSNAINILIILVIKYVILDEKKIHAQIQANKEKPKSEGKFQKKMREMMEKAQDAQKAQEQTKGKKK